MSLCFVRGWGSDNPKMAGGRRYDVNDARVAIRLALLDSIAGSSLLTVVQTGRLWVIKGPHLSPDGTTAAHLTLRAFALTAGGAIHLRSYHVNLDKDSFFYKSVTQNSRDVNKPEPRNAANTFATA